MNRRFVVAILLAASCSMAAYQVHVNADDPPTIAIGPGQEKAKQGPVTRQEFNELRWDIDDLQIATRSPEVQAEAKDISENDPWNVVDVSTDYPKWRLPYGVKIDDQRPPEVIAAAIERCKAGKGIVYMWVEVPLENGRERRVYFDKITWKDPAKAE